MIEKISGIICVSKRKSDKIFYIEVLADNSFYYKGLACVRKNQNLDIALQIYFYIVYKNDNCFFYIEDIYNFFGYYFWNSDNLLFRLSVLLNVCSVNLPHNIHIDGVYENFIYQLKNLNTNFFNIEEFKNWISLAS